MGFFCFNPWYYSVSVMDVMAVTALITAMPMPMPCLLLPFLGSESFLLCYWGVITSTEVVDSLILMLLMILIFSIYSLFVFFLFSFLGLSLSLVLNPACSSFHLQVLFVS